MKKPENPFNVDIDNDKKIHDFTIKWIDEILVYLQGKKELTIYN